MRRYLLLAVALSLASSCADAVAAPLAEPCTLAQTQSTPKAFWFPDGSHIDAVPVTVKLNVQKCPVLRGDSLYRAFVHGDSITYTITWPNA